MRILGIVLVGLVLVSGCGDEAQKRKDALLGEVMAVHDEVMPKMGDLRKTAKTLQAKADSLEGLTEGDFEAQIIELRNAAEAIEAANEGMMTWMRQFEAPDNEAPVEEVIAYLTEQKEKIDQVKKQMLESLEQGQELR